MFALLCFLPAAAMAQVDVNTGALDHLSPTPTTPAPAPPPASPAPDAKPAAPAKRPPRHPAPAHRPAAKPAKPAEPETTAPAASQPQKPASGSKPPKFSQPNAPVILAPAAPPPVVLPPLLPPLPARPLPAPTIPQAPDAGGEATKIPGGVRITFGPGKADLNPATEAALRELGRALAADPNAAVNVFAYAAGTADDPSTPRRISLSRALAARAVLMSEGIASTRIYPRALGNTPSDGPPDRVDVQQPGAPPAPAP
jgi:outer membrane protein OmpA-like peptidoglycan-associated protein